MRIITDSKTPEESKNPEESTIFQLYKHFATDAEINEFAGTVCRLAGKFDIDVPCNRQVLDALKNG